MLWGRLYIIFHPLESRKSHYFDHCDEITAMMAEEEQAHAGRSHSAASQDEK